MGELFAIFLFLAGLAALAFLNLWGIKRSGGTEQERTDDRSRAA